MNYEFHTTLPVVKRGSSQVEKIWATATMEWLPGYSSPQIIRFECEDESIVEFWKTGGAMALEISLIDDMVKLHYSSFDNLKERKQNS